MLMKLVTSLTSWKLVSFLSKPRLARITIDITPKDPVCYFGEEVKSLSTSIPNDLLAILATSIYKVSDKHTTCGKRIFV